MIIQKIFIDMDGVLADFNRGLSELLNVTPMPQENQPMHWQEEMWSAISEYARFYRDLEPVSGAVEGFNQLFSRYGDRVEILTGVPKPNRNVPFATPDKIEWVKKYLSPKVKVNAVLRAEKLNFCHGKDFILIDDYKKNIAEWKETGGTAILFNNWQDTLTVIEELENQNV